MSAYFITSCGTERGKTHVAEALIKDWLLEGLSVDVLKPIVSGFEINTLGESDTYRLLSAIGEKVCQESIEQISPWRYAAPLSPDIAAERHIIDPNKIDAIIPSCEMNPM